MRVLEIASIIPECCAEVLETMYFTTVLGSESLDTLPGNLPGSDRALEFSLDFVGDISGRFGVHLEPATARSLAANFLGEPEAAISQTEVDEVTCELANMLCGSVMSRVEGEHSFSLSHPEAGIATPTSAGDILVSILDTDNGIISVWVLIEGNHASVE